MSFKITGTGSAIPKQIVTNNDLSKILDTSDEWISTHVGTRERRILNTNNEPDGLITLAVDAGKKAILNAGLTPADISMVICSTVQGEYVTPSMSPLIAKDLGITGGNVIDMNMACCGFVYALDMADAYIKAGKASKVLIVCAEAMSRIADWTDRSTCVLFGDAAGAAVVEAGDNCIDIQLRSDGHIDNINMPHVDSNCPFADSFHQPSVFSMNGQEIYKFAVRAIYSDIKNILERNSLTTDDIEYFLLHQANKRIIDSAMSKLNVPQEKYPCNIEHYGNTSSATLPLLLDELNRAGTLCKGDTLVFSVFGAGLTTAVCIIKW